MVQKIKAFALKICHFPRQLVVAIRATDLVVFTMA